MPVVGGGIEFSLRRVSHYDYWRDRLRPSILVDAPVDILIYGMGERTVVDLARRLDAGETIADITDLPQTAMLRPLAEPPRLPTPTTSSLPPSKNVWPTNEPRPSTSNMSSRKATATTAAP